jgi:hypothetical protein
MLNEAEGGCIKLHEIESEAEVNIWKIGASFEHDAVPCSRVFAEVLEQKAVLYIGLFTFTILNEVRKLQKPLYDTAHPLTLF